MVMGKRGVVVWLFLVSVLLSAAGASASPTCMRFLKISTVPRIAGMGDAAVAVSDATWAQVNPAHLVNVGGSLITFTHSVWFQDISLETLSLGTTSQSHAFGMSITGLHTDPLEGYDGTGQEQGTFRFYDFAVAATYGRRILPTLSVGATGKVLYEKIDWDSATGFALDLGLAYTPAMVLLGGRFSLGLALRDLGPRMGYFDEEFDLPLTFQGGISYSPVWMPEEFAATVALDYEKTRDRDGGLLAGFELGLRQMLALRLGYRGTYEDGDLAFGVGLGLAKTSIDYAYVDMGDALGNTHRISLGLKVGEIFPSPEASR
jgi:hypothetical protein